MLLSDGNRDLVSNSTAFDWRYIQHRSAVLNRQVQDFEWIRYDRFLFLVGFCFVVLLELSSFYVLEALRHQISSKKLLPSFHNVIGEFTQSVIMEDTASVIVESGFDRDVSHLRSFTSNFHLCLLLLLENWIYVMGAVN